jgi:hypothetical protein
VHNIYTMSLDNICFIYYYNTFNIYNRWYTTWTSSAGLPSRQASSTRLPPLMGLVRVTDFTVPTKEPPPVLSLFELTPPDLGMSDETGDEGLVGGDPGVGGCSALTDDAPARADVRPRRGRPVGPSCRARRTARGSWGRRPRRRRRPRRAPAAGRPRDVGAHVGHVGWCQYCQCYNSKKTRCKIYTCIATIYVAAHLEYTHV